MTRLVYLIGDPGVGKSTALAGAVALLWPASVPVSCDDSLIPTVLHMTGDDVHCVEAGRRRGYFSGTDALSMGIMPKAKEWLTAPHPADLLIGEGDRLGGDSFFSAAVASGVDLAVVWLAAPPAVISGRLAGRGSNQNATWLKGRRSKVRGVAARWNAVEVDGSGDEADVAAAVAEAIV